MSETSKVDITKHPCFNAGVKGQFGRIHLPVAPKCNIKCNFCNRKYDCVNESRPGVTSSLLSPDQAVAYMEKVLAREPRITVAGIAGPGDPFANPGETMATLRQIRRKFPNIILCLASNGMGIGPYIDELAELKVSHVTITINAVDPAIGSAIYSWIRDGNVVYRGLKGAELLMSRQLAAIEKLKRHGITVKINSIVIPGINDHHIENISSRTKELGADLHNCMAMFPNVDTPFADIKEPSREEMEEIRKTSERYMPQMRHCTRCRADAVGLLDDDRTREYRGCLSACSSKTKIPPEERPYVAVATFEGVLVNKHLGEAEKFQIWAREGETFVMKEERWSPDTGGGVKRWISLARILNDCRAVLVSAVGSTPRELLDKAGTRPITMNGFIEDGLRAVFEGGNLKAFKARKNSCAAGGCTGSGEGCG